MKTLRREAVWRKTLKTLEWAVTLAIVALVLLACILMLAPRFGIETHLVLFGSTEPTFRVGGLVLCKSVPVAEIKEGNIIGFNTPDGAKVTHRVVEVVEEDGGSGSASRGTPTRTPIRRWSP